MKKTIKQTARCALVLGGIVVFCAGALAQAEKVPWKIDTQEAQRLAAEGWYGSDRDLGSFDPELDDGGSFFEFYGVTPQWAEGSFEFFAINRWTGDVWALWGRHKLSTPVLRKSQAEIRRRFTHDELKQYARLSRLKPDCIVED